VRQGHGPAQIAKIYGATEEMARFRVNTTGVTKQAHRRTT
jgi:hypothetical protein